MADYQDDPAGAGLFDLLLCVSVSSLLYMSYQNSSLGRDWYSLLALVGVLRMRFLDFMEACLGFPLEETNLVLLLIFNYAAVRAVLGPKFQYFGFL